MTQSLRAIANYVFAKSKILSYHFKVHYCNHRSLDLTWGQLNIGGTPYSFNNSFDKSKIIAKKLAPLNFDKINREDAVADAEGQAPRFGYKHKVNYNLETDGNWTTLPNGDRVWTLKIKCPNAKSLNLLFDHYWLPPKSSLYVYSSDNEQLIGGFSELNNKGNSRRDKRGFGTTLLYAEEIILEYYETKEFQGQGVITLSDVVQGYRMIPGLDSGGSSVYDDPYNFCMVNVNCSPEGDQWKDEKKGVALILVEGNILCSGSLVSNTGDMCTPNFLTAAHCGLDMLNDPGPGDFLDTWSFLWNYESPKCQNGKTQPDAKCTNGATVLSRKSYYFSDGSDFALLRLRENPVDAGIDVYFNGWSRTNRPTEQGVGIHHPRGDVKKISTHKMTPDGKSPCAIGSGGTPNKTAHYWGVKWIQTNNGYSVVDGGSSGSPLFMSKNKLIIGQLLGPMFCTPPNPRCSNPELVEVTYGRISSSWFHNSSNSLDLKAWLDPVGIDPTAWKGHYPSCKGVVKFNGRVFEEEYSALRARYSGKCGPHSIK